MTKFFSTLFLVAFMLSISVHSIAADSTESFLKVDDAFKFSYDETQTGFALKFDIAPGYYLYKERFKFKLKELFVDESNIKFSSPGKEKNDPYFGLVHVYHDQLDLDLTPPKTAAGKTIEVSYQGCAEAGLCYPPVKQTLTFKQSKLEVQQPEQEHTNENEMASLDSSDEILKFLGSRDLMTICGIFFLLGIGLTFTPCVFPMIPIISAVIAGQQNPTTWRSFTLALSYVFGMAITYSAAGVATGLLGASANLQAAFQSPVFLGLIATIFAALSLSMFGLYELQLPEAIRNKLNNRSQSLHGGQMATVFTIGALSALVVSPCVSAPLAGALLYISSTGNALIGGLSLLALGLGMGVPLIVIAVGGGKFLPKSGLWMERVKQLFGIMLLVVAIWLISRIIPPSIQMALWAFFLIVLAGYLGIFETAKSGWDKLSKGMGMFLFSLGVTLVIGLASGSQNILQPLDQLALAKDRTKYAQATELANKSNPRSNFHTVYSLKQLQNAIRSANQQNLPVMVDFYADWCISCKVIEDEIFSNPSVQRTLNQVYLVKADVTENDSESIQLLEKFNLFGPPSIVFYDRNGIEIKALRTVGEPSLEKFLSRLDALFKESMVRL